MSAHGEVDESCRDVDDVGFLVEDRPHHPGLNPDGGLNWTAIVPGPERRAMGTSGWSAPVSARGEACEMLVATPRPDQDPHQTCGQDGQGSAPRPPSSQPSVRPTRGDTFVSEVSVAEPSRRSGWRSPKAVRG